LCLGAEGAWVGSAFLASEEAGIQPYQKQAIVDAFEHRAMLERVRDAWPKITHPSRSPVYDEEVRVAGMREGIPLLRIDTTKVEDPRDNLRKVQDLLGRMFLIHGV
jgi:hypothetical protein